MDFSILLPLKRMENFDKVFRSIWKTHSEKYEIEILLYIDPEDNSNSIYELFGSYQTYLDNSDTHRIRVKNYTDKNNDWYNNWWQYLYTKCSGKYIMLCGDDNIFLTEHWDEIVAQKIEEYKDKIILINCNDGSDDFQDRATHPFVTREWCETLGYFTPGIFKGGFNDTWLTEIAKDIGRFVTLENVVIEHNHPDFQKAKWDEVYEKQKQLVFEQNAKQLFENTKIKRQEDSQKLIKEIERCGNGN